MNFDEAAAEELRPRKVRESRGRPFVMDLALLRMEQEDPDNAVKVDAALRNPREYNGRKLSRILGKMGYTVSYGAIENWRDRYTPGWRRSEGGY